ncbi:MAG: hypothetical protein ABSF25_09005 [Bryobacteraceae bacterium]|jgi:hypothetical protein
MIRTAFFALSALVLVLPSAAGEPSFKTQYVGGTVPGIPLKSDAVIYLAGADSLRLDCGKSALAIPYQKIETLEYGQSVSRRYAAAVLISPILLLSKSRQHFVTVGYLDSQENQQALVLRVGKGDIRSLLAALEARTGRRVEYQDEEARKSRH